MAKSFGGDRKNFGSVTGRALSKKRDNPLRPQNINIEERKALSQPGRFNRGKKKMAEQPVLQGEKSTPHASKERTDNQRLI